LKNWGSRRFQVVINIPPAPFKKGGNNLPSQGHFYDETYHQDGEPPDLLTMKDGCREKKTEGVVR
jgi:hypothetical protein